MGLFNWCGKVKYEDDCLITQKINRKYQLCGKLYTNTNGKYSYAIYYINVKDKRPVIIFQIDSNTSNIELLKGLFNYFHNVFKHYVLSLTKKQVYNDNNTTTQQKLEIEADFLGKLPRTIKDFYRYSALTKRAEQYVSDNMGKEYSQQMIIELLLLQNTLTMSEESKKEIIKKHTEKFVNNNLLNLGRLESDNYDFVEYCIPAMILFTDDEKRFINTLATHIVENNTVENLKLYYKLFNIHYYSDNNCNKNTLIKDYVPNSTTKDDYYKNYEIDNFFYTVDDANMQKYKYEGMMNNVKVLFNPTMITQLKYIENTQLIANSNLYEYINNLTIQEYWRICNIINYDDDTESYKRIIELALQDDGFYSISDTELEKFYAYEKLYAEQENNKKNSRAMKDVAQKNSDRTKRFVKIYQKNGKYNANLKVIVDYINSLPESEEPASNIINNLIYIKYESWLNNNTRFKNKERYKFDGFVILKELLKIMNAKEIVELLQTIIENESPLTITEWLNYIDNYEEYKDLPVSWCLELI